MKKTILLLLTFLMGLFLCACMKSEEAAAVDAQIIALGEITLGSNSAIENAEKAWESLTDEQKEEVENHAQLIEARSTYEHLVLQDQADQIDQEILKIGTVTLDKKGAVLNAEKLYHDAAPDVQALVQNKALIDTAMKTLDELQIKTVEDFISDIGEVTLESKDKIIKANKALYQLPENLKSSVKNRDILNTAITVFTKLCNDKVNEILAQTTQSYDKVQNCTFYYPKEVPYLQGGHIIADERCFILPYLGKKDNTLWLRLICNYTGDDWVFVKKFITVTDSNKYTTTLNYYDVIRDHARRSVWEVIDIPAEEQEQKMLRDISNSQETIVRFQGDHFAHDFIISESDKKAIGKMLDAYEYATAPYYVNHPEK